LNINFLLELDEDCPNKFHSSSGLKHALDTLQTTFLYILVFIIFIFIWIGVILWECLTQNDLVKYVFSSILKIRH
jgi:hypothetical protein